MAKPGTREVTKEQYQKEMDAFRKKYLSVWHAPKWARDKIREMKIVDPNAPKAIQPPLL